MELEKKFGAKLGLAAVGELLAKLGLTPQKPVRRPVQRQSVSAALAVNANGAFWFRTCAGALNAELFVELLKQMMDSRRKPALHFLRGHAPDLNPDKAVWSQVMRTGTARCPLQKGENLRERIEEQLAKLRQIPHLVRSFFQIQSVAYIGDW